MRVILTSAMLLVAVAATSATTPPMVPGAMQADLDWGPAPPVFPRGAEMAVMHGEPSGSGPFTVRLRFPNGYRIAPHTHPTDEHVTVISGTFRVGMGTAFEAKGMTVLRAGAFVTAPANQPHFAVAQGETVVQVHGTGPFAMTYWNPADNPAPRASR